MAVYAPIQQPVGRLDEDIIDSVAARRVECIPKAIVCQYCRVLSVQIGMPQRGACPSQRPVRNHLVRPVELAAHRIHSDGANRVGRGVIGWVNVRCIIQRLHTRSVQVGPLDLGRFVPVKLAGGAVKGHAAGGGESGENRLDRRAIQVGAHDRRAGHPVHLGARGVERQPAGGIAHRGRHQDFKLRAVERVNAHDAAVGRCNQAIGGRLASHTVVVGIAHPHPAGVGSLNAANRAGEVDAVQPLGFAGPG